MDSNEYIQQCDIRPWVIAGQSVLRCFTAHGNDQCCVLPSVALCAKIKNSILVSSGQRDFSPNVYWVSSAGFHMAFLPGNSFLLVTLTWSFIEGLGYGWSMNSFSHLSWWSLQLLQLLLLDASPTNTLITKSLTFGGQHPLGRVVVVQ